MPANAPTPPEGWKTVEQPPSLFRRFEFDSYAATRAFLDRLAALLDGARAFVLNSPNTPTGWTATREDLAAIHPRDVQIEQDQIGPRSVAVRALAPQERHRLDAGFSQLLGRARCRREPFHAIALALEGPP